MAKALRIIYPLSIFPPSLYKRLRRQASRRFPGQKGQLPQLMRQYLEQGVAADERTERLPISSKEAS